MLKLKIRLAISCLFTVMPVTYIVSTFFIYFYAQEQIFLAASSIIFGGIDYQMCVKVDLHIKFLVKLVRRHMTFRI